MESYEHRNGLESRIEATQADILKNKLLRDNGPDKFSLKYWNPSRPAIRLLALIFDYKTLGKWIYHWTAIFYTKYTPTTDLADELWLLLIQLYDRVQAAEEYMTKLPYENLRELLRDDETYELNVALDSTFRRESDPLIYRYIWHREIL